MDCFYSISMKHDDALRDAFLLSEKTIVEIKDDNYRRVPNAGRSAPELLDELLSDEKNHLVFILRRDMEHVDGIKYLTGNAAGALWERRMTNSCTCTFLMKTDGA